MAKAGPVPIINRLLINNKLIIVATRLLLVIYKEHNKQTVFDT